MAAKKSDNAQKIVIKPIKTQVAQITIVGDTPLVVHRWSEKAKKEILDKEQKKNVDKKAKPPRDPFAEFVDALYWITPKPEEKTPEAFEAALEAGAKFGFPTISIKLAALSACYRAGIIPNMTGMKSAFHVNAVDGNSAEPGSELVVIETDEAPRMREDMVKLGGIGRDPDLRYRPEFRNWKMRLNITLNDVGTFDMESVINAINLGGYMNGIGEWRMERDGDFGRYHVEVGESA